MRALIVYDSYFGNTEAIAEAIASELRRTHGVTLLRAGDVGVESLEDLDLLVVGSPTRGFRETEGVTAFLNEVPRGALSKVEAAAFDTRISVDTTDSRFLRLMVRIFGYAARPVAKKLAARGATIITAPAGFVVEGSDGPLRPGEYERAAEWIRAAVGPLPSDDDRDNSQETAI